jgi:hypothetical protein
VVVAEVTVEVAVIGVLTRYLTRLEGLTPAAAQARVDGLPSTPTSKGLQKAFKAITGHPIAGAPGWKKYADLLQRRHDYVHKGEDVDAAKAAAFIDAADQVSGYVTSFANAV